MINDDKFKKVSDDIITAISKLDYTDTEKRLIQVELFINIRELLKSKNHYEEEIHFLRQKQNSKKYGLKM